MYTPQGAIQRGGSMKKTLCLILFFAITISAVLLSSCSEKDYTNYKNEEGYEEYISDTDAGYDDLPYYNCEESMEKSKAALRYYENNSRRCGDYIITDYEDGVCINRYVGFWKWEEISVPETLDGKPVVKIGAYPVDNGERFYGVFSGCNDFTLILPSTVKYIGNRTFLFYSGIVSEDERDDFTLVNSVKVSEDNPYYTAVDGVLYSKDKKALLYDSNLLWINLGKSYNVPNFVEVFEPSNGVADCGATITIGENVKKINTFIDKGEDGTEPNPYAKPWIVVRGEKDSAAEKWAKEQYAKFEEITKY